MPSWIDTTTYDAPRSVHFRQSGPSGMVPFAIVITSRLVSSGNSAARYRCSSPRRTWKLVTAFHYAYIRRDGSSGIVSFAVTAVPGRHSFAFSDIDPATADSSGDWSLQSIMRISVELRPLGLPPSPSALFLAGTPSPFQISTQRLQIHLEIGR
jgi:hypothetical protein